MTSRDVSILTSIEPVAAGTNFGDRSAFSVDIEEWFQVGAFENTLHREDWPSLESRVERQTHKVLELLERHRVKGTFFCLGWVVERHPLLIKAIHDAGHEVACHGRDHKRLFTMTRKQFLQDVAGAKAQLEDATGVSVKGYRAPSFSLRPDTWWAYECLEELGFHYSSSIYPIQHDHYGMPEAPRRPFWPIGAGRILEVPMSVYRFGRAWPASGGGYFRLLPYMLGKGLFGLSVRQSGLPGVFYMHPWEMDPDQPYVENAPWLSRFRHYTNQDRMAKKVGLLCESRKWARMDEIYGGVFGHADQADNP